MPLKLSSLIIYLVILIQIVNGRLNKLNFEEMEYEGSLLFNFTELSAKHNYPSEEHTVVTEDGYVLTLFRLPKGKNCREATRKPPVLIMHGLLLSSDSWIDSGPDSGLGYLIADECYDLWLGNGRGNHYSRKHLTLNPDKDIEFWQFSPNEVGFYDLPAIIDYVLYNANTEKLNYIGYSQSGGMILMMCSERPEYCAKVRFAILLHPASKMKYTKSKLFRLVTKSYQMLEPYLHNAVDFEALPQGGSIQKTMSTLCQNYTIAENLCRPLLNLLDSSHPGSITSSTIRNLVRHFPAGTSTKSMTWFSQILNANSLTKFDYGSVKNLKVYGKDVVPHYNINATNIPVVIIHGKNDHLVSSKDVKWLKHQLPNVLELFYVKDPLWNHLDVIYSKHTINMIFPKIKEYLLKNIN